MRPRPPLLRRLVGAVLLLSMPAACMAVIALGAGPGPLPAALIGVAGLAGHCTGLRLSGLDEE
ncbi:hypothetical protein WDZ11_00170 (plasmid) [Roseomonas mucosa]|uniref:hypothetical protein n=1 Tax=Roseomonas mucosa TaxID=207340 RepID=UPI0030D0CB57